MARLTEEMVIARSKQSDLTAITKLNCWGAELGDVSLLRRMPNLEVLALSINKIRSLCDFADCVRLRELYVRKNEITSLAELRYLRRLPNLTSLWLEENPCTKHPQYRMTVLRNLPNLEKLDNVQVQPDEVQEAMRRGSYIPDSDDEGYPQQESYGGTRRSAESSPEPDPPPYTPRRHEAAGSESSEGSRHSPADRHEHTHETHYQPTPASPTRREPVERENPMTRSHYISRSARSPDAAPLRHSLSAHSVKEYAYSTNGECRGVASPPNYEQYYEQNRCDTYQPVSGRYEEATTPRERGEGRGVGGAGVAGGEYPSAVMSEHWGFTRRPVARNSNLLSAVLCLVKELDYPSLEVAEMAVRCRMDELANSQ